MNYRSECLEDHEELHAAAVGVPRSLPEAARARLKRTKKSKVSAMTKHE